MDKASARSPFFHQRAFVDLYPKRRSRFYRLCGARRFSPVSLLFSDFPFSTRFLWRILSSRLSILPGPAVPQSALCFPVPSSVNQPCWKRDLLSFFLSIQFSFTSFCFSDFSRTSNFQQISSFPFDTSPTADWALDLLFLLVLSLSYHPPPIVNGYLGGLFFPSSAQTHNFTRSIRRHLSSRSFFFRATPFFTPVFLKAFFQLGTIFVSEDR